MLNKNIKIFENSPIDKIEEKSDNVLLFSKKAVIKSKKVIVACNGYLDNLLGSVRNFFMPINNYIIATEPLGEKLARQIIKRNWIKSN